MAYGTVKFFNTAKGFVFIEPDEVGKDVFVHATALGAAGIRMLKRETESVSLSKTTVGSREAGGSA
jgi:CspA family cold shock protein